MAWVRQPGDEADIHTPQVVHDLAGAHRVDEVNAITKTHLGNLLTQLTDKPRVVVGNADQAEMGIGELGHGLDGGVDAAGAVHASAVAEQRHVLAQAADLAQGAHRLVPGGVDGGDVQDDGRTGCELVLLVQGVGDSRAHRNDAGGIADELVLQVGPPGDDTGRPAAVLGQSRDVLVGVVDPRHVAAGSARAGAGMGRDANDVHVVGVDHVRRQGVDHWAERDLIVEDGGVLAAPANSGGLCGHRFHRGGSTGRDATSDPASQAALDPRDKTPTTQHLTLQLALGDPGLENERTHGPG